MLYFKSVYVIKLCNIKFHTVKKFAPSLIPHFLHISHAYAINFNVREVNQVNSKCTF